MTDQTQSYVDMTEDEKATLLDKFKESSKGTVPVYESATTVHDLAMKVLNLLVEHRTNVLTVCTTKRKDGSYVVSFETFPEPVPPKDAAS